MKQSEEIAKGHLSCIDCIYYSSCNDINDRCIANDVQEGDEVHFKKYEGVFYDGN